MFKSSRHSETFRQEAEELLADIEMTILDLEQNPGDMENVNRLFRSMHTIKGSGAMFGFTKIAGFTHHVETVLDRVREGAMPVTGELIDLVLASRDHIKALFEVADGRASIEEEAGEKIISAFEALMPKKEETGESDDTFPDETFGPQALKPGENTYRIRFTPGTDIVKTGMDPVLIVEELKELGDCLIVAYTENIPELAELVPDECHIFWDITLTTVHDINTIRDIFIFTESESQISIQSIGDDIMDDETAAPKLGEILVDKGDTDSVRIYEALSSQKPIGQLLVDSGSVSPEKIQAALTEQKVLERRRNATLSGVVRVPSEKLDHLINLVGELVITQAHFSQIFINMDELREFRHDETVNKLARDLSNPVETLERLIGDLRDCALNMRMVPIGTIFGKFRRLVRDLSAELGKEIELVTTGAETELDKTVIERLNDPLVHLIRNSIDHGIQMPDERVAAGKQRNGTIRLNAFHQAASVVISIEDDGRGIDAGDIFRAAKEKGLLPEERELSEQEILGLVFTPGFSTSEEVTKVSGRGVGLDVVKREIDALSGNIRIESQKGEFSKFYLSLPLTLAIIDGLLVDVGGDSYVLPLAQVEECAELTDTLVESSHDRDMIMIRGDLVPFVRLRKLFGNGGKSSSEHIAVVNAEDYRVGIVVDEIVGNIQTVIKSLDRNYREAEGISGATIMGDGTVALIIDIPGLIRCARNDEEKALAGL